MNTEMEQDGGVKMEVDNGPRRLSPTELLKQRGLSLTHHGVKGMHWGVRKKKPTTSEIHDARARQESRFRQIQDTADKLNLATDAASRSVSAKDKAKFTKESERLAKEINRLVKEHDTSEDRVTGSRFTTGEKVAQAILLGPFALLTIGANKHGVKKTAKEVDQLRAATK